MSDNLPTLATAEDVAALLGRGLTTSERARVDADLVKLSARFRREARRQFTPGTSTVRRKINGREVWLPESPVTAVTAVLLSNPGGPLDGEPAEFIWTAGQTVYLAHRWGDHRFVLVTYNHGADQVPPEVLAAVAEAAKRPFDLDEAAKAGAQQASKTAGPFTESRTYPAWAIGGEAQLSPNDLALARTFRPKARPTLWVMGR